MELEERLSGLSEKGLGVAAISYDSQEVLAEFSVRNNITFPLLSDENSNVIESFGILNTVAVDAEGPNSDDPDIVADVAKYVSAFGSNAMFIGTPYPGTFVLDGSGSVTARFFEEFYRERATTANIMLSIGDGLSPIAAIEGSTAHLDLTAYPSDPVVTLGSRFSVVLDVNPKEDIHVYAPGAESKGYLIASLILEPSEHLRFEQISFPSSEIYYFEPLDERVEVYQEPFRLLQEVVVDSTVAAETALGALKVLTLSGTFNYQACNDELCFDPVSVPLSFTLEIADLDRQRVG